LEQVARLEQAKPLLVLTVEIRQRLGLPHLAAAAVA
jgi:hypothetical protein